MTDELKSLSPGSVGRSSVIVGAGFAGAQVIGIVRELFLANHVGLSGDLDALLVSLGLTTIVASLITGGASGALVPLYLEARSKVGRGDARRLAGSVISWLAVGGLAVSVMIAVLAPVLTAVAGPGLSPKTHDLATDYLRFLTPVTFLSVITTMMRVICQAEDQFGSIAIATVAGPAATVATMLLLWEPLNLGSLVVGNIVGAVAMLVVYLLATARADAVPIPGLTNDARLRGLARHAIPVSVSGGILELRGIVDRAIATLLGPGSVSALRYATVLITPLTQIGPAWSSVIYPRLVHLTLNAPDGTLATWVERTLRSVVAIFLPIAALSAAVAPVAVFFAYGRGAFTAEDQRLTAEVLAGYTPIVLTLMMLPIVVGSLNARRRGGMLLLGGAVNVTVNIVLDLVLAAWLGAPGIALSTSIAEIVVVALFIRSIARSTDAFDVRPFLRTIAVVAAAIAPFAIGIGLLSWNGFGTTSTIAALVTLGVFGIVGVLGYLVLASTLGIETARGLIAMAFARLGRSSPPVKPQS